MKKYIAEVIGTFILVFFGTGVAVVSGGNLVATALAFGLAIICAAHIIGNISGCHVNPAVSLSMVLTGKMSIKEFLGYAVAQVAGAFAGSLLLYVLIKNTDMYLTVSLGANGYGELSQSSITLLGGFITEVVLTFVFIYAILGVTSDESKKNVAPFVIGLTLTFVHLIGIGLTGTSVNPARSLAPAVIMGGVALKQVWLFIVAPFVGAAIASLTYKALNVVSEEPKKTTKKKSK